MLDLNALSLSAAKQLRGLADSVEVAGAPRLAGRIVMQFDALSEHAKSEIERVTAATGRDRAIYVLTLDDSADADAFGEAFDAKRREKALSLPQYNGVQHDSGGKALRVIYVGSSCWSSTKEDNKPRTGTLRTRLTQHLTRAPKGTYALNLGVWASSLQGGIIVDIYNYPAETSRDVVVAVEDALSQELKPICGRRGIQR